MHVQTKIRLLVIAAWTVIIGVITFQSYHNMLNNYLLLEKKDVESNYIRSEEAIKRMVESLVAVTGDWANWTDTYDYLQNKNARYINENLTPKTTFKEIGINYLLFFNNNHEYFDGRSFDLRKDIFIPVEPILISEIKKYPVLTDHSEIKKHTEGFISANGNPIVVASYAITNSDSTAQPNGNIIMGFNLDDKRIEKLSKTLNTNLKYLSADTIIKNIEMQQVYKKLSGGLKYDVITASNENLLVYSLVKNINDIPIGMFVMDIPRSTYQLGLQSIHQSIIIEMITGIIVLLLLEVLLRYFILNRFNKELNEEIAGREMAEKKLADLHTQLMIASRQSGMADIASSVLHNIGNTLNSMITSVSLIKEKIIKSEINHINTLSKLIEEHQADINQYITNDQKGKGIIPFISILAQKWETEKKELMEELETLTENIHLTSRIIAIQESDSHMITLNEKIIAKNIVEDALTVCKPFLLHQNINIIKNYENIPEITIDKVKLLQILVNLIKNSSEALNKSNIETKNLFISISDVNNRCFEIGIKDNGIGMSSELLEKIFTSKISMKTEGYGIGLHTSSLSAHELGGELHAISPGPGKGATFILKLPYLPKKNTSK